MTKHCNRAHIHGIIKKFEKRTTSINEKSYLEVICRCPHETYGPVRVLAKLWGGENVDEFRNNFSAGDEIILKNGWIQQWPHKGVTKTSFNFFEIDHGPIKEMKATFILTGEVLSFENEELSLLVKLDPKEETFKVRVEGDTLLDPEKAPDGTPEPGQTISAKGYFVCKEDDYGDAGPLQPVVKELKYLDDEEH